MSTKNSLLQKPEIIQQVIFWLLLGGFLILLVEIRFEHQVVLGEKWQPWIPIIYLMLMTIIIPTGVLFFKGFGRGLLIFSFIGLALVGMLGFWFHSKGKPIESVVSIVETDFKRPGHIYLDGSDDESKPPVLAPLSLVGLAAIGVLMSLWQTKSGVK